MDVSTLNKPKTDANPAQPAVNTPATTEPRLSRPSLSPMRSSRWVIFNVVVPLVILLAGALVIVWFGKQTPPQKPADDTSIAAQTARLPEVDTLPVRSLDAAGGRLNLKVDGVVVPYREIQLATEVAGQVIYKDPACEVGSYVQQGQLLIRIDPADYQSEVDRLTKLKEQEYQAIRELEQESVNTKRLLEVATSEMELQDREVKRLKSLPSGYASQSELDQAQRTRLQLMNNKVTLENQMDLMRQRRTRLEAAEQLAETQLALARRNLERTEIRSPVDGVIFREDAELNSFVQRGSVIVTVEDTDKAEVVVNLRTDQLYWVLDQQRAKAATAEAPKATETNNATETSPVSEVDRSASDRLLAMTEDYSLPQTDVTIEYRVAGREEEPYRWSGKLERYDGIGFDPTSRTVPVRVVVDNPRRFQVVSAQAKDSSNQTGPTALVRGMFVSATLHIEPRKKLVIVPGVALKPGSPGNRLWKFVPDASVLQPEQSDAPPASGQPASAAGELASDGPAAGQLAGDNSQDDNAQGNDAGTAPEFNPDNWVVGRVEVLNRVRPIESATLEDAQQEDGPAARGSNGMTMYWICEIGEGELSAGDRLVVSPLPSFEGRGRDGVRVPRSQIEPVTSDEIAARQPDSGQRQEATSG